MKKENALQILRGVLTSETRLNFERRETKKKSDQQGWRFEMALYITCEDRIILNISTLVACALKGVLINDHYDIDIVPTKRSTFISNTDEFGIAALLSKEIYGVEGEYFDFHRMASTQL